jgi:hypothetical protein
VEGGKRKPLGLGGEVLSGRQLNSPAINSLQWAGVSASAEAQSAHVPALGGTPGPDWAKACLDASRNGHTHTPPR